MVTRFKNTTTIQQYVCMHGHTYSKSMDQPGEVASPRSRLRIWSRETGSAVVPSRVSLLISVLGLNLVPAPGIPPEFRGGVHLFLLNRHTPSGHSLEFIGSRICVPVGVHWRESAGTGLLVKLELAPNGRWLGRSPWTK